MAAIDRFDQSQPTLPLGYRGVRGSILVELKRAQPLTTKELASRLGVSLNAVRHHLKELEEQEVVHYQREHRGVGAPTFAYRLAQAGEALFPRRYEAMLSGVLDGLVDREGRAGAVSVLEARYTTLASRLQEELAHTPPAERLTAIAKLLSDDGYMAEATVASSIGTLTEHNCAVQGVAERFPEICAAEARFLSTVLGAEVSRERHILNGCTACEYRVRFDNPVAAPVQENT
jgi:DeoR family transcriptional regulator, suf operon transcriptional repressor